MPHVNHLYADPTLLGINVSVNVPFLLGEANSASCGGQKGVSNAMASALWAVDFMMAMAQTNVSRINFHGGGNAQYSWLGPVKMDGSPDVKSLFYGMYMFSESTKGENTTIVLLKSSSSTSLRGKCLLGSIDKTKSVCCSSSCGRCRGKGCGSLSGGPGLCCTAGIMSKGKTCRRSSDVGCVLRVPPSL